MELVALVPMRHGSERVPGKNHRPVGGRPLFAYILEALLLCPEIDEVVVDTDSPPVHDGVARLFPSVRRIERPAHLASGDVPMNDVILHDLGLVTAATYLQTHSTNPLLRPETIRRAIAAFQKAEGYDSLFSVTPLQARLWTADGRPLNHDPGELIRTQDLPPLYQENSCLYLFRRETFLERRNRIGARPLPFEIGRDESWDIDDEFDLVVAEALLERRSSGAPARRRG